MSKRGLTNEDKTTYAAIAEGSFHGTIPIGRECTGCVPGILDFNFNDSEFFEQKKSSYILYIFFFQTTRVKKEKHYIYSKLIKE